MAHSYGVPVTGSLSGTGDEKTYQVEVAAGEHLTVVPDATVNNLYDYDLYIRYGALPTTVVYDDVGDGTGADQSVQVAPPTQAGIYYLMIRSVSGDSSYVIGVRGFCHRVSLPMILRDR